MVRDFSDEARANDQEPPIATPASAPIFATPIGIAGQRLAVIQGKYLDSALFEGVRAPTIPELTPRFYEVRAELRAVDGTSVLLASRLRGESGTMNDVGTVVLNSLIEPGQITLFVAEGPDLYLWSISVPGGSIWTPLKTDKPWHKAAAAYQLNGDSIQSKLARTKDGRLAIEVHEKVSGYNNLFEETKKGSLEFSLLKQWK